MGTGGNPSATLPAGRQLWAAAALAVLLAAQTTAWAASKSWNKNTSTSDSTDNLNLGANWTPSGVPGNGDDALMGWSRTTAGNANKIITNAATDVFVADSLSVSNRSTKDSVFLFIRGTTVLTNGAGALIFGGATGNDITMNFSNSVTFRTASFAGAGGNASLNFAGAGSLTGSNLVFTGATGANRLRVTAAGGMSLSGDLTVSGGDSANTVQLATHVTVAGRLSVAGNLLDSYFTITNGTLTVSNGVVNTGRIDVLNKGVFDVVPVWTNSGVLSVSAGGRLTGGTVTNLASGTITGAGVIDSFLVNQGRLLWNGTVSNSLLQTAGSFTLSGVATITGAATLGGGALNLLGNRLHTPLLVVGSGGALSNTVTGATISGGVTNAGTVFFSHDAYVLGPVTNTGSWTHRGVISNDVVNSGTMTLLKNAINALVSGGVINTGSLTLDPNAFPTIEGSLTNSGSVTLSGTIRGNYLQSAGSLILASSAANIAIEGVASVTAGSFNLNGRSYSNGLMVVSGTGVLSNAVAGARFSGALSNAATVAVTADTFFNGPVVNTAALFLRGAISNSLVSSGSISLNNNATITGPATLVAGRLDLNGHALANGLMVVTSAATITNSTAGAVLRGMLRLENTAITGAALTNAGTLVGAGSITALLVNAAGASLLASNGTLAVPGGFTQNGSAGALAGSTLNVPADWSNNGTVTMQGGFLVGGTLTNLAGRTVAGFGAISNRIVNAGLIRAADGTLSLAIAPATQPGSGIAVASNGVLNIAQPWSSSGTISIAAGGALTGGTLTNTSATGTLSGSGFIKTFVVNQGRMDFGGTISNGFLMTAGSFTLSDDAVITGPATISGGSFNLFGSGLTNTVLVIGSGGTLLNSAKPKVRDAAIEGTVTNAGTVLITRDAFVNGVVFNTGTWTHNGTFSNDVFNSGTMTILKDQDDPRFTRGIVNTGTLVLGVFSPGATGARVDGSVTNAGFISAHGTVAGNYVQTAGRLIITNTGTFSVGGIATLSGGTFDLNGRSYSNALMVVSGTGVLSNAVAGASFSGALSNAATVAVTANTFFKGAITNTGQFFLQGAVSNTVANSGTLRLNNTATVTGLLGNLGTVIVTNGTLQLLAAPVQNGTISIAAAGSLNVTPAWANSGTVLIHGGFIAGGTITNSAAAHLTGFGTLSALLVNPGTVTVTNGTLHLASAPVQSGVVNVAGSATLSVAGSWVNTGLLNMHGGTVVNQPLNNSGTIAGFGTISAPVSNPGYILATNGTLRIQALTGNQSTGTLEVGAGATLSANGVTPWLNNGRVILAGGTVVGGNISNAASRTISGHGTLATTVLNSGTLLANVAGSTLVFGDALLNSAGGVVTADTMRLVVNGVFTNRGTFTMMNGIGTFNAAVVNQGAWITDPTTNVFHGDLFVDTNGYIAAAAGDVFIFKSNFLNISRRSNDFDTLAAKFIFDGGSHTQAFYVAGINMQGTGTTAMAPIETSPTNSIAFKTEDPIFGFSNNFALGTLEIGNPGTNSTLVLIDSFGTIGSNDNRVAGLYLETLTLFGNSILLISNNVQVYTKNTNNVFLDGPNQNVFILGNGSFHMLLVVPEPSLLLLWWAGGLTALGVRRAVLRRKRQSLDGRG